MSIEFFDCFRFAFIIFLHHHLNGMWLEWDSSHCVVYHTYNSVSVMLSQDRHPLYNKIIRFGTNLIIFFFLFQIPFHVINFLLSCVSVRCEEFDLPWDRVFIESKWSEGKIMCGKEATKTTTEHTKHEPTVLHRAIEIEWFCWQSASNYQLPATSTEHRWNLSKWNCIWYLLTFFFALFHWVFGGCSVFVLLLTSITVM